MEYGVDRRLQMDFPAASHVRIVGLIDKAHRAVIFAIAQLSCFFLTLRSIAWLTTHAVGGRCVIISGVCDCMCVTACVCVCVRAEKEKRPELTTSILTRLYRVAQNKTDCLRGWIVRILCTTLYCTLLQNLGMHWPRGQKVKGQGYRVKTCTA